MRPVQRVEVPASRNCFPNTRVGSHGVIAGPRRRPGGWPSTAFLRATTKVVDGCAREAGGFQPVEVRPR